MNNTFIIYDNANTKINNDFFITFLFTTFTPKGHSIFKEVGFQPLPVYLI